MKFVAYALLLSGPVMLARAQTSPIQRTPVSPFKHIVVIFQENRSPDNLFQGLCSAPYGTAATCSEKPAAGQYDIQTSNWADKGTATGVIQPGLVALDNRYDLSHAHTGFTAMCDADPTTGACRMDGAADVHCSGTCLSTPQFRYVNNANGVLNPYLDMATQYGWANYMFQTNQGPSYPAHQFIFGGTSAPTAADDAAGVFASENISNTGISGTSAYAGCAAPATNTVQLIGPDGVEDPQNQIFPCFEHKTLADILPSSLTWRYYAPGAGSIWTAPNSISHICQSSGPGGQCLGQDWTNNVDLAPVNVLKDINSCNLRNITWVIPSGANSDHANINAGTGPSWVASIVNAIGNSSSCDNGAGYWKDTAIVLSWDDWGGWYDHEPPTTLNYPQGAYQYGFRVPLVVISAYTPKRYINNVRHDFGSVLRFVESNFGIQEGILNFADARAQTNLFEFFDFTLPPRQYRTIQAPLTANFFLTDKRKVTDPDDQ